MLNYLNKIPLRWVTRRRRAPAGHYIDSQIFGLSYLFAVGIPSAISARKANDIENDLYRRDTHDFFSTEKRANRRAARYFKKHYGINWSSQSYKNGTYEDYYPLN